MQVPAHFEYERATSVGHALALLAKFGPESRVLAGGHSLIPMMKLRLAQPETLIDINDLAELGYLRVEQGELRIGALTRHAELLGSALAGQHFPILHDAERRIADPVVRNRGTIGGSLCQADPSEDLSAAFAAVRATMVIQGGAGTRTVPEREFHLGPYETVVAPDELLAEIRVPIRPGGGSAYVKVDRRAGDWPVGAAGAALWLDGDTIAEAGIGLAAVGAAALLRGRGRGLPARRAGHRRKLRPGRADRRRALPADLGPARPRRLQAPPGRRAHRPRAAAGARAGRTAGRSDVQVTMTVNDTEYAADVEPRLLLIHFLRDHLGLTGSHWGCDTSNCGACVVWLDETPVKSCTVLAAMADGHRVRTVEGLERGGELDPVQQGFTECHGLQCGFCTPGMMMTARWLLDHNPDPSAGEIREALSGQVCRCTGYENIVRSVRWAAEREAAAGRAAAEAPITGRRATGDRRFAAWPNGAYGPAAGRRTPGSSGAAATSWTTSRCPGCCTGRSCAARWRTPGSPRSTRGGRGAPQGQRRSSPARCWPSGGWPGCPPCPRTCRRCWPPTRCGSRARRSPSSSPRTGTRPATRSSSST